MGLDAKSIGTKRVTSNRGSLEGSSRIEEGAAPQDRTPFAILFPEYPIKFQSLLRGVADTHLRKSVVQISESLTACQPNNLDAIEQKRP